MSPHFDDVEIVQIKVGLRPTRPTIRMEPEWHKVQLLLLELVFIVIIRTGRSWSFTTMGTEDVGLPWHGVVQLKLPKYWSSMRVFKQV